MTIVERVAELGRLRTSTYILAIGIPLVLMLVGVAWAMPAFVFEHIMIVIVVVLAVAGGRGPAIVAALVGTLGDNIALREPVGQPAISGLREIVDLALFLAVALVVGLLVDRLRSARAAALEAASRERAAREELDRLVSTLTHDLATPLTAIQGTVQFARKHAASSAVDVGRLLARVETAAARATSLVRALTDARSIEQQSLTLRIRPVDLRTIVEPIVGMLDRVSDRHPIALVMEPAPVIVNGDADRLGRVVENLIANAIKYSPTGGAIEVCLRQADDDVALTVRDHGVGIPEPERQRVFEIGYRSPQTASVAPGLGLGLFTAAEVVRRHGGRIDVDAAEGGGTTFTVRLPRVEGASLRDERDEDDHTAGEPVRVPSRTVH